MVFFFFVSCWQRLWLVNHFGVLEILILGRKVQLVIKRLIDWLITHDDL